MPFAGFATDATHVSSSGTALAQIGIANAFANATNLETLGTGVALATTPAGNGTVPQTEINSLANILADCTGTLGASSNGCTLLFGYAPSGGVTGLTPTDTATAAINIAHNPGRNVAALYGLASAGTPPFMPGLSAVPNDFTVAISFTGGGLSLPIAIAIDGSGNAWAVDDPSGISKFSPLGAPISGPSGYLRSVLINPESIAIDSSSNVWVGDGEAIIKSSPSGALIWALGLPDFVLQLPVSIAIDGSGNVWAANNGDSTVSEFSSAGTRFPATRGMGSAR